VSAAVGEKDNRPFTADEQSRIADGIEEGMARLERARSRVMEPT